MPYYFHFLHRQNGVDDLIKLAKQFDFNMLRQDEEHVQIHNESVISDMFYFDGEKCQSSLLLSNRVPEKTPSALQTNVRESSVLLPPDQDMEDDLNFLFDGPTQHISGNLSEFSSSVIGNEDGSNCILQSSSWERYTFRTSCCATCQFFASCQTWIDAWGF